MKKLFLFLFLCTNNLFAQDVIEKNNGDIIRSKVLEVTPSDIKYKKESNPNGPTYTINISDVKSINYENGEKEIFDNNSSTIESKETNERQHIHKAPDARNSEILALYNRNYKPSNKIKPSRKLAKRCLILFGVKENSIMSNDDVEVLFKAKKMEHPNGNIHYWCYEVSIKNKTENPVFIDKANCFRVSTDDDAYCYYNNQENGMIPMSLSKRIIKIPGYGTALLTEEKWNDSKLIEAAERFRFKYVKSKDIGMQNKKIQVGQTESFGENELPWSRQYYIAYSHDISFPSYSLLSAEFYIKEIIGCSNVSNAFQNGSWGLGIGLVEGVIKYDNFISDFNEYTVVAYHKFDEEFPTCLSSSYAVENGWTLKDGQEQVIANAIAGTAFSTINVFTQMQNGGGATNRGGTMGTSYSGRSTDYGSSSYSSNSNTSSSRSSSNSKGPVCRNCNGGGKCPSCHGKGIRTDNSFGTGTDPTKKCGVCGGDGICNTCGGSGHKN